MVNDFQAKLNTITSALHTINAMKVLFHDDPGYEKLIDTPDGLRIWEGLCEDLMVFIDRAPMIVGAAIINILSRDGRISFTRVIPHLPKEKYDGTIVRYREFMRRMVMIEDKAIASEMRAKEGREAARAVDEMGLSE